MSAAPQPASEPTISGSLFEAFARAYKPEGSFKEELVRGGFDPDRIDANYPGSVWTHALRTAAAHLHPSKPRLDADRQLGIDFVAGFNQTIIGKMASAMTALLTPKMILRRMPRFSASIVRDPPTEVKILDEGEQHIRFEFREDPPHPYFNAGTIEGALRRKLNARAEVRNVSQTGTTYELHVTW
jgi:uncharacterized protein (TIGR02265 family)